VKEVHQIFDLVRLESVSESGHSSATIVNLMLNLLLVQAFADGAQVWAQVAAASICTVAVLTSLFMKERGSGVLALAGVGLDNRSGRSRQAARQGYDNGRETDGTDSRRDFAVSLQRNIVSFCDDSSRIAQLFLVRVRLQAQAVA
jgi:hypothetical protein